MAVSERAQVPTPAQRRAASLERSRSHLTFVVLVLSIAAVVAAAIGAATGSGSSGGGGVSLAPGLFAITALFALCFAAAAGAAAFVLAALRDAALAEAS
jgi:hypothetical protein